MAADAVGSSDMTVLVVEDNAELLEFLRDHLAVRYRVLAAENSVRGLAMARTSCRTVILLTARASRDSRLPDCRVAPTTISRSPST